MSRLHAEVSAMVEQALKKNRKFRSTELQERAVKIDETLRELSGRQFHARYVIQTRRRLFGEKRSSAPTNRKTRNGPTASGKKSALVVTIITDSYKEKKARLNAAIDAAFERTLEADSVKGINTLFSSVDRSTSHFERV